MRDGLRLAYLNQEFDVDFTRTVWEEFMTVYDEVSRVGAGGKRYSPLGCLDRHVSTCHVMSNCSSACGFHVEASYLSVRAERVSC